MTGVSWPRDAFARAIWSSELKPLERLVGLAYAEHAGDQEFAWVTYPRLQEVTGLSRDAISRALSGLRDAGWLVLKEDARQHFAARYWLRIPAQHPASQTTDGPQESVSRTADMSSPLPDGPLNPASSPSPESSSPSPDTSSPPGRPDHSTDLPTTREGEGEPRRADAPEAVATILAAHGAAITEAEALAAINNIDRGRRDPVRNMPAFVARLSLADLRRHAGRATPTPAVAPPRQRPRCANGSPLAADGTCCAACATETARNAS